MRLGDLERAYKEVASAARWSRQAGFNNVAARMEYAARLLKEGINQQADTKSDGPTLNAMKTHCPRGHEYTEENTQRNKNTRHGGMMRQCRECKRVKDQARTAR